MLDNQKLHIMPTGNARIVSEKNGFYKIKFENTGDVIYFPKDFIDNIPEEKDNGNQNRGT